MLYGKEKNFGASARNRLPRNGTAGHLLLASSGRVVRMLFRLSNSLFSKKFPKFRLGYLTALPKNTTTKPYRDTMKILIVEDEPQLQELIAETLTKERYIVEIAKTLSEAREKIGLYSYDGVLLDLMLPDGSGLTLLEEMKQAKRQERIIIISARDAVEDKVKGLELGADDYLSKPFHLIELSARLRSVIRRNQSGDLSISLGNVEIFPDKFSVTVSDNRLELNRKEYDILLYFANRVDRLVRKELLAEAVWGDNIDQVDNFDFIYTQIKNLRKKLQDSNANIKIKSVYGIGYKMVME